MKQKLQEDGSTPLGGTPEQFAAFIKTEHAKWGAAVRDGEHQARLRSAPCGTSLHAAAVIEARVSRACPMLPQGERTRWGDANKPGHTSTASSRGRPSIARATSTSPTSLRAHLPHPRRDRVALVAQYDGWPNGRRFHRTARSWITDYRADCSLDVARRGAGPARVLGHRNSESFTGVNDLTFDADGNCYFTDQGQTGSARSERARSIGCDRRAARPALRRHSQPNGIALDTAGKFLLRRGRRGANQVWRGRCCRRAISKVGAFRTFFGASGPDGMAVDVDNGLVVAPREPGRRASC
jgi:gluconolactonase